MSDYDLAPGEEVPDTVLAEQERAALADMPPPPVRALRSVDRGFLADPEAEAALLGAAMRSRVAADLVATVQTDAYTVPAHQHVAHAIKELHAGGHPLDPPSVAAELRAHDLLDIAGGTQPLMTLFVDAPPASSAPRYAQIVRDLAQLRRLGALGTEIAAMATAPGAHPTSAAGQAQALLDEIHDATAAVDDRLRRIADTVVDYTDQLEARQEHPLVGISSGLAGLDTAIGGFQRGRFYTIAGRPGMGKSDVAIVLARTAANAGHQTLVTSIEMPTTELLDRWVANGSKLSASILSHGELGLNAWERITAALVDLQDLPIWIDDNPASTIASIRADVRRSGAELVIIDYLQIVETAAAESRQVEVTVLARALKRMARELDIPVIALAQLNRGLEQRHDKRPQLSDLRESGAIEQESDVVIGLYQDAHYVKDSADRGVMELIILKNRTGPLTTVKVAYLPDTKTIANLAGAN